MLFADVKAPFFVVAIVCDLKITAAEALIAVFVDAIHLVDNVHIVEGGGVTLRDGLQSSIDLDFDLTAILGEPIWLEGVINEAMSLHTQMVILAEFYDGIHGRTSVNMDGILRKTGISFLGLKGIPIKWDDGVIEKPSKLLAVESPALLILKLIEEEGVTAEFEFMGDLLDLYLNVIKRRTVLVLEQKLEGAFSVFLNIAIKLFIEIKAEAIKFINNHLHLFFLRHGHISFRIIRYNIIISKVFWEIYRVSL
jgi:hypothetical protein